MRNSWLTSVAKLFVRRGSHLQGRAFGRRLRRRPSQQQAGHHVEHLEERRVMAFDFMAAYTGSNAPFYVYGDPQPTLIEAPSQITLRLSPGATIDASTLSGITVVRSGGAGDGFGAAGTKTDVSVVPGSITVGDLPNQNDVVIRFAETLPDDSYRIKISGSVKTTGENRSATAVRSLWICGWI